MKNILKSKPAVTSILIAGLTTSIPASLFDLNLISVGIAVAIIGLVQGAGVSLEYPNPPVLP